MILALLYLRVAFGEFNSGRMECTRFQEQLNTINRLRIAYSGGTSVRPQIANHKE